MNSKVTQFIKKSKLWEEEIEALREILLKTKLEEDFKWQKPCYAYNEQNVAIIQPFKSCLALMFFKGSLLKDARKILIDNGPNSQAAKRLEFTSVQEIKKMAATIKAYVKEAIAFEETGRKVEFKKRPQPLPEELKKIFAKKPLFKKAFDDLTPGRQRGYLLYFGSAKQASTRQARIEKCLPAILKGKGLNDR
jgi:uncharacterized protein YdeI (YjbR/CyaY-like superfamily)